MSVLQAVIFKVVTHPHHQTFHQCVTETFLRSDVEQELVYNVFSVTILYFIPLSVIVFTYARILCKIYQKSKALKESPIEGYFCHFSIKVVLEMESALKLDEMR